MKFIALLCILQTIVASTESHCQFQLDSIASQHGWSGIDQEYYNQPDMFTFGVDKTRGESIVDNVSYTGNRSWWLKRGLDSPGSGTPYSPSIDNPTNDFEYSVWIKAASSVSDGSKLAIITGNEARNDRASNYIEVENKDGVLYFNDYDKDKYVNIANGSLTGWNHLRAVLTYQGGVNDSWTYYVNQQEVHTSLGYFNAYFRPPENYAYETSRNIKFQPKHPNKDASYKGFYIDDLQYSSNNDTYYTGFEGTCPPPTTTQAPNTQAPTTTSTTTSGYELFDCNNNDCVLNFTTDIVSWGIFQWVLIILLVLMLIYFIGLFCNCCKKPDLGNAGTRYSRVARFEML